jgi:hypothetical protein
MVRASFPEALSWSKEKINHYTHSFSHDWGCHGLEKPAWQRGGKGRSLGGLLVTFGVFALIYLHSPHMCSSVCPEQMLHQTCPNEGVLDECMD